TLQTGGNVTIPCHYDNKYIQHKKYWCCHSQGEFNHCEILAYGNTSQDRVTVTDYPAQSLFTVTMRDLQSGDTGMYWCAVEIGGIFQPDTSLLVFCLDPDLSVVESNVSGQEGGSVSVQCLYTLMCTSPMLFVLNQL
uniref:Ig-like domain-containing protein n=1 Tax=Pygocentrus nattereri TaxID=42514 RepID=A0A3B4ENX8_PYGNA